VNGYEQYVFDQKNNSARITQNELVKLKRYCPNNYSGYNPVTQNRNKHISHPPPNGYQQKK